MGLDIYLYTRELAAQNDVHDRASEALYERPDYESLTGDEKRAAYRALPPYAPHVGVPSERYPDHLFNRRYLRSSYNGGGFNHAVPEMLATSGEESYPHERGSLYWIFEPLGREWDGDDGDLTEADLPALAECRKRAETVARDLAGSDRLRVITVSPNIFSEQPKTTENEALAMYRARPVTSFGDDSWYSVCDMNVFGKGLSILAAIPGIGTFKEPGVHLIYRAKDDGFDSYVQSAEIVVEFCDEAIALIERDGGCRMSWSG